MSNTSPQGAAPASNPAPFIHRPQAAVVYESHPDQRLFHNDDAPWPHSVEATWARSPRMLARTALNIWRSAKHDAARLEINVSSSHGRATLAAYLIPSELRDLAQRLLDAAADIEAHPSTEPMPQRKMDEVPA